MDNSLYLNADPVQCEKQISTFQSSHDEWQNSKRILRLQETTGVQGEEYHDKDDKSLTLESVAHLLFQPGMKFIGKICIPSLGDGPINGNGENNVMEKEPYELLILERGVEFGNDFILGAHNAYDDTQCVYININIRFADGQTSEQVLDIDYEDEETCIKGRWNTSSCCLEGCVRQRIQANDGAFHSSNEVTHIFTLHPCTNDFPSGRGLTNESLQSSFQEDLTSAKSKAVVELRNTIYSKGLECAGSYNDLFQAEGLNIDLDDLQALKSKTCLLPTDSDKVRSIWKLRESNWADLSKCRSMMSEQTCARFRHRAYLLDQVSFESGEEKRVFFEKWKRAGFCLHKAHAEWDNCEIFSARVFQIAYVLSRGLEMEALRYTLHNMLYKSRRLYQNYDNLESSWRRAKARQPLDFFTQFEVSSHEVSEQFTCSICFEGVANEENDVNLTIALYRLPCSHCFHGACVQKWFHCHLTCPICRSTVTDADNKK